MKTASAKAKGRRLQQWVAAQIGNILKMRVGPDEMIACREMGQPGPDIRLVGQALELFPWAVECKNCEIWRIPEWVQQAKAHMMPGVHKGWILVVKRNGMEPLVIMDAELGIELIIA